MIARGSWILVFCLSVPLCLAAEPEGPEAPRQSQVPRRRVRRTYDQQVQIHQPGETAPVAPPEKETFVPGEVPATSPQADGLLSRPTTSFTGPPAPAAPRPGEEAREKKEDAENDLWILKSPEAVLGVSTQATVSSILGGWVAEGMATQNEEEENPDEAEAPEDEEAPGRISVLSVGTDGPSLLQVNAENLSSNAAERTRFASTGDSSVAPPGREPETDRFAPQLLERAALIREVERPPNQEPEVVSAPALPKLETAPPPARAVQSDAGSFSTKWEPPSVSPSRVPDSPGTSYGRMGSIFSPEPAARAPSSLGLPPPGSGYGASPAPVTDTRLKAFGTPGPLLPPLQTERAGGPAKTRAQPFLPSRYEP